MGFPSLHENILERINEALSSLIRDEEHSSQSRSVAEEEARLNAIKVYTRSNQPCARGAS